MKKESKGFWAMWYPMEETVPCSSWLASLTLSKARSEYRTILPNKEAELPGVFSDEAEMELACPAPSAAMLSCTVPLFSWGGGGREGKEIDNVKW